MYGTVARMQVKPGAKDQLTQQLHDFEALHIPGFIASYLYQMDTDPNDYYMAVIFETKESYVANAQSPEQDARYGQMRALLTSDPEWHDGAITAVNASAK